MLLNKAASQRGATNPIQLISLFLVLMIMWLLWSGLYKPLLIGLGLFSCVLSVWLAQRMGFFRHVLPVSSLLRLPAYYWWLLTEIIKSSINVAKIVLTPSLPISPTLIELTIPKASDVGKVTFGNSITLSPGTVTIDEHQGRFLVHCLTRDSARELLVGQDAQERIKKLGMD